MFKIDCAKIWYGSDSLPPLYTLLYLHFVLFWTFGSKDNIQDHSYATWLIIVIVIIVIVVDVDIVIIVHCIGRNIIVSAT